MQIIWLDRLFAAIWWAAAITLGPLSIVGFFAGGWLVIGALAALWMNMDVHNPFKRSTDSKAEWQGARRTDPRTTVDPDEPRRD